MTKFPEVTKSYDSPMGFSRVLHVVPRDTLVQELQGGAASRSAPAPVAPKTL